MVGPPAINASERRTSKAQDDGWTGRGEECEGGGEKSERYERKVVIERANFSTCGQWRERARKRTRHIAFTECSESIVFRKRDECSGIDLSKSVKRREKLSYSISTWYGA